MRRLATLFLILAFLSSCATTAVDPKARTFRSVGVISLAGSYLRQMNVGVTVFGNEYAEVDVSDWNLDKVFGDALAATLRDATGLQVSVIGTAPASLRETFKPTSAKRDDVLIPDSRWEQSEEAFKRIATENRVEVLALLVPAVLGDYLGHTNQEIRGLGIYTRSLGDRTAIANLHLVSEIVVISGATGKVLARLRVSSIQPVPHPAGHPNVSLPATLARTPFDTMTRAQKEQLREFAAGLPLRDAFSATVAQILPK